MSKPDNIPFETTIAVRDNCLCLHSQRAARALARRFDTALRTAGLTSGQFSMLMSLNAPRPASIGVIASVLAMDRTTLTANLKPLERRGLISIGADPTDRRGRLLALTDAGHAALLLALPIWRRTHDEIENELAGSDADALRAGLRQLY